MAAKKKYTKKYSMSDKGYEALMKFEGAFGKVYDDLASGDEKRRGMVDCYSARGTPTIGVGHVVYHTGSWHRDECDRFKDYFRDGKTMTKEQMIQLMKEDIPKYEKYIDQDLQVPITQEMYDALVNMVFNTGGYEPSFKRALALTNQKKWKEAAEAIRTGDTKGGLKGVIRRRKEEAEMYLSGGLPDFWSNYGKTILISASILILLGGTTYGIKHFQSKKKKRKR